MLLNELLARSLEQGHTYALCRCGGRPDGDCRVPCASSALHRPQMASIMSICATPVMLLQDAMLCIKPRTATHLLCARPFADPAACAWRSAPCSLASSSVLRHGMLNQAIAQRIERMNGVQDVPEGVRQLGAVYVRALRENLRGCHRAQYGHEDAPVEKMLRARRAQLHDRGIPGLFSAAGGRSRAALVPRPHYSGRRSAAQGLPHRKA